MKHPARARRILLLLALAFALGSAVGSGVAGFGASEAYDPGGIIDGR
jgi:hypothetical protein